MSAVKRIFKIRRKSDGLFSNGGTSPSFTKKGKIWSTRGGLTNHFHLLASYSRGRREAKEFYADCEVVTFELTETVIEAESCLDHLQAIADRNAEKERKSEERRKERVEAHERQKARELLSKYGPNP